MPFEAVESLFSVGHLFDDDYRSLRRSTILLAMKKVMRIFTEIAKETNEKNNGKGSSLYDVVNKFVKSPTTRRRTLPGNEIEQIEQLAELRISQRRMTYQGMGSLDPVTEEADTTLLRSFDPMDRNQTARSRRGSGRRSSRSGLLPPLPSSAPSSGPGTSDTLNLSAVAQKMDSLLRTNQSTAESISSLNLYQATFTPPRTPFT